MAEPVSKRLSRARKRFIDPIAGPRPNPQRPVTIDFMALNKTIFRSLKPKERKTLRGVRFNLEVSTKRIGDFPIAGARFTGVRQTVVSSRLAESGVRKPVPGSREFGGGGSVKNLLEHEMRHQLLQAEGVPPKLHHQEAANRGGRFLRGLVDPQPTRTLPRPRRPGSR